MAGSISPFQETLRRWQQQPATFSPAAWSTFIEQQAPVSFTPATLPADEALWGSFWQGDVIAPGYVLPALELAFLRASRLEADRRADSPTAYLQILQTTLRRPPLGVWLASFPGGPALCLAGEGDTTGWQFVWLAEGFIVASYRDHPTPAPGRGLTELQRTEVAPPPPQPDVPRPPLAEWGAEWPNLNRAGRIDRLVRLHRLYSHLAGTPPGQPLGLWLDEHAA